MTAPTTADLIAQYLNLRAEKKSIADRHKEELAPYNAALEKLETFFMAQMDGQGSDSISVREVGTAYRSSRTNCIVTDFDAFRKFVQERSLWHMLQARASAEAVTAYMQETGEIVPGTKISTIATINVRKA